MQRMFFLLLLGRSSLFPLLCEKLSGWESALSRSNEGKVSGRSNSETRLLRGVGTMARIRECVQDTERVLCVYLCGQRTEWQYRILFSPWPFSTSSWGFCLFVWWIWGLNSGFTFAKQTLYSLSHTSSPFCFAYFGDEGIMNYLLGLVSNCDPPDLSLQSH
jgi:hypothetical protein